MNMTRISNLAALAATFALFLCLPGAASAATIEHTGGSGSAV